jgi:two-component sensor histidine kinase
MVHTPVQHIIGSSLFQYIHDMQHESLKNLLHPGKAQSGKGTFAFQTPNHAINTVLLSCHNLELGNVDGISIVATDISELHKMNQEMAASLKEKEAMLKEVYHRVKNNLQVMSSLLNLQARTIADPVSRSIFVESSTRIKAMALVHEMLYQSNNLVQIEMGKYVKNLLNNLADIYHADSKRIKLIIDAEPILLSIENAVPWGLVINELISNAFKHAFPAKQSGEIKVSIKGHLGDIILMINDNGVGFPSYINFENSKTLGMQLIQILTKQLGGNIVLDRVAGTTFTFVFPSQSKEK